MSSGKRSKSSRGTKKEHQSNGQGTEKGRQSSSQRTEKRRQSSSQGAEKRHQSNNQAVSDLLHAIKAKLQAIPTDSGLSVDAVQKWSKQKKISIPFVGLPKATTAERDRIQFSMAPPTNVAVVGSFLLDTMVSPANVDLFVEMPKNMFGEKDDRNYIYFLKRAYYLAKLAECLQEVPELKDAIFGWKPFRGHVLKPTLSIKLKDHDVELCIYAGAPSGLFKMHRFAPGKNLVRKDAFFGSEGSQEPQTPLGEAPIDCPTPVYNSLLQLDMTMIQHLKILHSECKRIPGMKDAIKLGKAWIQQRGYQNYNFHLSGFQFSMICVYLAKDGQVASEMTDVQIFKTVMTFLSKIDWSRPIFMQRLDTQQPKDFDPSLYAAVFAASLVEPIMGMNVLFDWTAEVAAEVRRDAVLALQCLSGPNPDFNSLFLLSDLKLTKFDGYYQVQNFSWMPDVKANFSHYLSQFVPELARVKMIAKKLKFGLDARASDMFVHSYSAGVTPLNKSILAVVSTVGIGLILNRDECQSIVRLGPLAESTEEVKQFRHFWRERSELRRFQDGSIREAVAWDSMREKRHHIVVDIIKFVMENHFQVDSTSHIDTALDFAWMPNASFIPVQDALQKFTKTVRSITDLPLSISHCEAISTTGRMTCITPPKPIKEDELAPSRGNIPDFCPVVKVLIYLEGSSRWPLDYYGMLYAKQAFSIQICRQLSDQYGLQFSMANDFFDVSSDEFVFRCYIHHDAEVGLMKFQNIDSKRVWIRNEEAPKHARAISSLASGNSIFAPTCRLFKKWLSSQMYFEQIGDELCELLCSRVFLQNWSPNSVVSGFASILKLLLRHPWEALPLPVDFEHGESKTWSLEKVEAAFADSSERPLLWIAPSYESNGNVCVWSKMAKISTKEFLHLKQLAEATLMLLESGADDAQVVFQPSSARFNLTIFPTALNKPSKKVANLINNGASEARFLRAMPGFDPLKALLEDLKEALPEASFYRGEEFIGVIFDKDAIEADHATMLIKKTGGEMISSIESADPHQAWQYK